MERPLSPLAFLIAVLIAAGAIASAAILLPHDRYYRYQALDNGTTRKADWIYERLHFDDTPVDVALIGTSRTAGGLSEAVIEHEFCAATGRRIHVANLGLPETGRNLHFEIAKEALRAKRPALLIVELNEVEARRPHRSFIALADAADVLAAPAVINLNYFSDIIRLPGRQAELFATTLLAKPAVRPTFDPRAYPGSHYDRTTAITLVDGRVIDKRVTLTREALDRLYDARRAAEAPMHALPGPLQRIEYRFSRRYLAAIRAQADASGAAVAYAFLPAYRAPAMPADLTAELKVQRIDFDLGGPSANDPALWFDATHWNAAGAELASLRLGAALARTRPDLGVAGACPAPAG